MPKISRVLGALFAALALLSAAGCASTEAASPKPGQLKVIVAFYPFQYVAERVGGAEVAVSSLTQPGAEPHDLELTPKQVASLSDADVVIYQKGFQAAVDKAVEQTRPKRSVDIAEVVGLKTFTQQRSTREHGHEHGHDHDHGHDHEHGHDDDHGHDHDHGGGGGELDPHTWLDPTNMVKVTQAVRTALADAKPDQAPAFEQNAQTTEADLMALDREFQSGLAQCMRREFIASHAAFGYLADRYGLSQIGIRGLSADQEPSPARIAEVHQIARENQVTTIFYETLVSPDVAKAVAGDLRLRTDVLDPLEGLTDKSRGSDYIEVMKSNLNSLKAANECQ